MWLHPGKVLYSQLIEPNNLTVAQVAEQTGIDVDLLYSIVDGEMDITSEISSRLADYFGNTEQFWLKAQICYNEIVR